MTTRSKIVSVVKFYQVKVCTERGEDCAVSLQISCRPYLRPSVHSWYYFHVICLMQH